jgi:hypothetical protein
MTDDVINGVLLYIYFQSGEKPEAPPTEADDWEVPRLNSNYDREHVLAKSA